MVVIMEPDVGRSMAAGIEYSWVGPLAFGVVCYVLSVALSSIILPRTRARFQVQSARPGLAGLGRESAFRILLRVPFLPFVLIAELLDRSRVVRRNPVYWRESGVIGRSGRMSMVYMTGILGYAYVILAAIVVLNAEGRAGDDLFQCTASYFILATFFVGLFVAVSAGSSIASEREENTLDTFLSTRFLNHSFVLGKFFGVLRSNLIHALLPISLLAMAHAVSEKGAFLVAGLGVLTLAIYIAWIVAIGIVISSASPSPARAVSFTVGFLLVICIGVPILAAIAREYIGRESSEFLLTLTPGFWAGVLAIDPDGLQTSKNLLQLIVGMAVYIAATVVMLIYAVHRFGRLTGRR
jgi:ABC-type transport system involved in multi-copper enzyme maturation permease subunit